MAKTKINPGQLRLRKQQKEDLRFMVDGSLSPWIVPDAKAPYEVEKPSESQSTHKNESISPIKDGDTTVIEESHHPSE